MDKEKLQDKLKSLKGKEYLDKIKSVDGKEILDKIKSVDAKELLDKAKSVDAKEYLDKIKSVDAKELLDKAKSVDAKELLEKAKSVDAKELLEKAKSVDGKELLGKAKSLNPKKKKMILIAALCCLCLVGGVRWLTKSDTVPGQSSSSKKSSASNKATDPRKANAIRKAKAKVDLPPQSEQYKQGEELRKQKNNNEASKFYEAGVEKGDPWCMGALGIYYSQLNTRYLPNRRLRHEYAAELLSKAAEQNVPFAYYWLGDGYLHGGSYLHLEKDTAKGLELLTKAAELNDLEALYDLSRYYLGLNSGSGIPKDTEKGIELMMQAAELDDSRANALLGGFYEKGEYGLEKDPETALSYYKKAQELGNRQVNYNIITLESQIKHQRIREKVEAATKTKIVGTEVFLLEYSQNEIAANKKYKGKKVCIEGTVAELGQTGDGGACVVFYKDRIADQYLAVTGALAEALTGSKGGMKIDLDAVVFRFDKKYLDDAAALNKGERVIIMGETRGRTRMNLLDVVELQHCRVPHVD